MVYFKKNRGKSKCVTMRGIVVANITMITRRGWSSQKNSITKNNVVITQRGSTTRCSAAMSMRNIKTLMYTDVAGMVITVMVRIASLNNSKGATKRSLCDAIWLGGGS